MVLTNSGIEALQTYEETLSVQGINLFPCVYGSRMINAMLYSSIFAFFLSYYLYLYSIESKIGNRIVKSHQFYQIAESSIFYNNIEVFESMDLL